MAFNGRLDINYAYIDNPPKECLISCCFYDFTGLYYGDLIGTDCRIIQDVVGAGLPIDVLAYRVIENQGSSDFGTTYTLRAIWDLEGDPYDLMAGYTTVVGAADQYGIIDLPEPLSQSMDVLATARLRNFLSRLARPTLAITNDNYSAVITQESATFTSEFNFNPSTVKVFCNGLRLKEGVSYDYVLNGLNGVDLNFIPLAEDTVTIEYSR